MAAADALNALLATTLANYRGKLIDNVFDKHVLTWLLKTKGGGVKFRSSGEKIVEHLLTAENSDAGSYAEWEAVDITPQGGIDIAEYPWKTLFSSIAISGLEEAKNNGKEAIINLLKARVMQSEKTLQRLLNDQLWGNVVDSDGFGSILDLVDDTVDVGGLDSDVDTFWQAPTYDMTDETAADTLRTRLTNLYNTASDGSDTVNALIGDQATFELYESLLVDQVRYTDKTAANMGFTNLAFKGVPFYWDKAAPVGTVVGLNFDHLNLVGHKNRWFKQSKFTENPIDSAHATSGAATWVDARYAAISSFGNVTTDERRRNFKLVGVDQTS